MKNTLKICLFALVVLVLHSCQKEITPLNDSPVTPVPPVTDSGVLLVKYLEIDSVPGSLPDTSGVMTIEYDAQKRVTAMISYNSTSPADNLANYEKFYYHYNGTDTLPDRLIYQLRNESGSNLNIHVDTSYYTYTADGKLESDSSNRNLTSNAGLTHYVTTRNFNYQSGFFTVVKTDTDPSFAGSSIDSVFLTTVNGNITAIRFAEYTLPDYAPDYGHSSTYAYDNNPNPFYRIKALASTIQLFEFDNGPLALLQKNNVTSITQLSQANENVSEHLTYTYKTNGYPAVFYSTYASDWSGTPETRYYKGVFIYN